MKIKEYLDSVTDKADYSKKNFKLFLVISVIAIACFAVLAYLFPYSGDDWSWGGYRGIIWLKNGFQDLNGRYSGNILVMALTRVPILKAMVMALSFYLACFFSYKYSESLKVKSFIFSLFFFFTASTSLVTQVYVWTSGFSNYLPSILIIIGYIILVSNIIKDDEPSYGKHLSILTFIMGLIGAMFMENITIYAIVVAVAVMIYCHIKHKKVFVVHISYLVGSILGAIAMFSNPVYWNVLNGEDYYRNIAINKSNPVDFIIERLDYICMKMFIYEIIALVILTVLAGTLVRKTLKSNTIKNLKVRRFLIVCRIINSATLILLFIKLLVQNPEFSELKFTSEIATAVFVLICVTYFLSLTVIVLICLEKREMKIKATFLLLSIPVMVAPLVVVSPIGSRNFFSVFYMYMMLAVIMFENTIDFSQSQSKHPKRKMRVVSVLLVTIYTFYLCLFVNIHNNDKARIA